MNLHSYNIKWGYKNLYNGVFTVKFDIIFQSDSLNIERYCKQHYPNLLERTTAFSIEQLQQLYKMRLYIKRAFKDHSSIIDALYSKGWFGDLPKDKKFFSININDFDCKYVFGQMPYLALEGVITFNVREMFNHYIDKGYVQVNDRDNSFVKEVIDVTVFKTMPMLLTYESFFMIKDELLSVIKSMMNTRSKLLIMLEKKLKINNLHTFKKDVTWVLDNTFRVTINDYVKLTGAKIKQHAVPLTLVGLWAYNRQQKKKKMKEAINIFSKMVDVTKEIIEKNEQNR